MHIVAGTFSTREEAHSVLPDLEKLGIVRPEIKIIQGNDEKGFEREHRLTRTAALRGALAGVVFGLLAGAVLLAISRYQLLAWRPMALYLGGVIIATAFGAVIATFWNMGYSHDEALLFEEARKTGAVIAAIEVVDPLEHRVADALRNHGASNVRLGKWRARGWRHSWPTSTAPTHEFRG